MQAFNFCKNTTKYQIIVYTVATIVTLYQREWLE